MAKKEKKIQEKESGSSEIVKKFKQNPGIYIGSVIILILVTVTFIGGDFISGGGLSGSGGDFVFGYYDKIPISYVPGNYFANNREYIANFYQTYYQIDVNDPMFSSFIWRQAYDSAVAHTAVLQIMKRSKYEVSQGAVDREVAKHPRYQENGRFSLGLYRQDSESSRLSIWRERQEDLTKVMFLSDFNSVLLSGGEAEFIAEMSSNLRNFGMASFMLKDYPDENFRAFASENPGLFNSIHLSIITVTSGEREAKRVLDSIKEGTTTFEDAAKNHSQDFYANMGGDIGNRFFTDLYNLIPDASNRDVIFSLRRGEISDIIYTDYGWSFFRVEHEAVPADLDDETIMERVRSYMRVNERGRITDWAIERANEFVSDVSAVGFDDAVSSRNMEMQGFGPLPMNYGNVDLFASLESFSFSDVPPQVINSLSRNESFWRAAFSAPVGTPTQPLVEGDYVFVFYPFEETKADESSIEYILTTFKSSWQGDSESGDQQRQQYMVNYLLNSGRMNDQFNDAYNRYLR